MISRFTSVFTRPGLISLLMLLILAPASALAAPGGGAQVLGGGPINVQGCTTEDGLTVCFDGAGEDRYIITPTGLTNYQLNFRQQCVSIRDDTTGNMLIEQCFYNQHHREQWNQNGELQLQSIHETGWISQGSGTCTVTTILHRANGQVQYDRSTADCTLAP